MRERDAAEVFARRWDDDPLAVAALICQARWGKVLGLPGKPIAVVGAHEVWPRVASVFMLATDDWPQIALSATRWVKRTLIPVIHGSGVHRADCQSIADHDVAHRWLRALGARHEATHPMMGRNGETFLTFVWERDDVSKHTENA